MLWINRKGIMESIGSKIKLLRLQIGLTQEQLVAEITEKFGYPINVATLSLYENNKRIPNLEFVIFISKYFNCSYDYLLGNNDNISSTQLDINELRYMLIKKIVRDIDKIDLDDILKIIDIMKEKDM